MKIKHFFIKKFLGIFFVLSLAFLPFGTFAFEEDDTVDFLFKKVKSFNQQHSVISDPIKSNLSSPFSYQSKNFKKGFNFSKISSSIFSLFENTSKIFQTSASQTKKNISTKDIIKKSPTTQDDSVDFLLQKFGALKHKDAIVSNPVKSNFSPKFSNSKISSLLLSFSRAYTNEVKNMVSGFIKDFSETAFEPLKSANYIFFKKINEFSRIYADEVNEFSQASINNALKTLNSGFRKLNIALALPETLNLGVEKVTKFFNKFSLPASDIVSPIVLPKEKKLEMKTPSEEKKPKEIKETITSVSTSLLQRIADLESKIQLIPVLALNDSIFSDTQKSLEATVEKLGKAVVPSPSASPITYLTSRAPVPSGAGATYQAAGVSAGYGNFSQGIGTAGDLTATGHVKLGEDSKEVLIKSKTWNLTASGALSGLVSIDVSGTSTFATPFTVSGSATSSFGGGVSVGGGGLASSNGITLTGGSFIYNSANFKLESGGNVGIGTTTPGSLLSVHGGALIAGTTTVNGLIATSSLNVLGSATSTFSRGINITGTGCFAINDTCVGGGSGSGTVNSGTTNRLAYYTGATTLDSSGFLAVNNAAAFLGIATTTPGQKLSVAGNAYFDSTVLSFGSSTQRLGLDLQFMNVATSTLATSTVNAFSFATSTTAIPFFTFDTSSNYRIGVGTTSPANTFSIAGNLLVSGGSGAAATSTFNGGLDVRTLNITSTTASSTLRGLSLLSGGLRIATLDCSGLSSSGTLTTDAQGNVICSTDDGGTPSGVSGELQFNNSNVFGSSANLFWDNTNGRFGIASSTPTGQLSIEMGTSTYPIWVGDQGTTTPIFVITGSGNIGIGTTTPGAKLSIGGPNNGTALFDVSSINFASSSATSLTFNYFAAATSTIPNNVKYAFSIATSTASTKPIFTISTDGNSWATTTVHQSFSIDNNAFLYNAITGTTTIDTLSLGALSFDTNAGAISWMNLPVDSNATNNTIESYSAQIDDISVFTVFSQADGGGNVKNLGVGIATTTPGRLFSVAGSAYFDSTVLSFGSSTQRLGLDLQFMNIATSTLATSTVNAFSFATSTTATPIFTIDTTSARPARVGIATTSPWADFSIEQTGIGENVFAVSDFGTSTASFIVKGNGRVGIGTSSPGSLFSINTVANFLGAASTATSTIYSNLMLPSLHATSTNVVFSGLITDTGAVTASLCLTANSVVTRNTDNETCIVSSERYKKNIETLSSGSAISVLSQLRPVTFEYKDLAGLRYGFIAEEIDKIDKMLVSYNENGLPHSVRYVSVIPLLTQAIQELNKKINSENWSIGSDGKLFVKEIETDKIKVKNPYGITIFDADTGEPVCVISKRGVLSTIPGECGSNSPAESPSDNQVGEQDTSPPVIEIIGANPSEISVGAAYSDNGVTVADNVDLNLGYQTYLDGSLVSEIQLDTSTTTTYNIEYRATDNAGNTGNATRIVNVIDTQN